MDIYVKELPKNCGECPCCLSVVLSKTTDLYVHKICKANGLFLDHETAIYRKPDWCPLKPIDQWRLESCETCDGQGCGQVWNKGITGATCCDWQGKAK
jgi:hypothetical protein